MSDYYYFEDKESNFGYTPVLGDDYVMSVLSIAKQKGVKITHKMILNEIFKKKKKASKNGRQKI